MVAAPGRPWRIYAWPVAFLVGATIVVVVARDQLFTHHAARSGGTPTHVARKPAGTHAKRAVYVVRAGDTVVAISGKTGVPTARLLQLNPGISPTALFIGEKIKLR